MRRAGYSALAPLLALSGLLASCGGGISGEYRDELGTIRYEFQDDGRVYTSVLGIESVGSYEVDGERVLLSGPSGSLVLSRDGDALIGPMGLRLYRYR